MLVIFKIQNNRYFFVNYTAPNPLRTVVSRFQVTADDPDVGDELSEHIIIQIDQPFSNHNGGQIVFGPDSYLYIGMGDGGWFGDPYNNGQDLTTLLGAILRIDVDTVSATLNYGIPVDNPFAADTLESRICSIRLDPMWINHALPVLLVLLLHLVLLVLHLVLLVLVCAISRARQYTLNPHLGGHTGNEFAQYLPKSLLLHLFD